MDQPEGEEQAAKKWCKTLPGMMRQMLRGRLRWSPGRTSFIPDCSWHLHAAHEQSELAAR
jgi:hypothetical protein